MKSKCLSFIVSLFLMCTTSLISYAAPSSSPITEANHQLRHLFQYVTNPNPNVKFLYQLGAHIIDSAYFSTQCTLTSNCDIWFYAYKELGWCAYDTTWMESDSSVYARACSVYADTITFGIMDWKYNTLIPEALTTNQYFNFNLFSNQLSSNITNQSDAYTIGEIFMSSPLMATSQTNRPVFKISPSFIFSTNDDLDYMISLYDCYIDFDDGNGPQYVSLTSTNYHQITYNTPGYHILQTTIRQRSDTSIIVKRSNSGFVVSSTPALNPSEYTDMSSQFPGLKVYQFDPLCDMGGKDDKIIFILAGYNKDMYITYHPSRDVSTLYNDYIVEGNREVLRQFGYTFVLVEWENADRAIQQNATYVMNVLEYYKCNKVGNEQFVLIGESMGSLVGRYALTYMESPYYISPNDCCLNTKHNVRLFISNDGPHLGANIPLSIQEGASAIENVAEIGTFLGDILPATILSFVNIRNQSINGTSVKQMLLYHYSTEQNGYYTAHPYHDLFLQELENLGGYPQLCKNVALSNGSLLGYNQQQCFDTLNAGQFRLPNDDLLGIDLSVEFHVLGFYLETGTSLNFKTNPNGSGPLINFNITASMPSIRLYLWGIEVLKTQVDVASFSKYGYGLIPYCVSAGGAVWLSNSGYAGNDWGPNFDFGILFFGIHGTSHPNSYSITLDHGIPWLLGGHITGGVHTDGAGFCLVPVQSAFCYNPNNWDLQRDYTSLSTTTMFSNTFFDVLSGHPSCDQRHRYNGIHTKYRNNVFTNQLNNDTMYYYHYEKNDICDKVESRILNREVGDEELFLDNSQLYGVASYSALIQLYVNVPHPYYNFDGQTSTIYKIPGVYCRTDPFLIQSGGYATFRSANPLIYGFLNGDYLKEQVPFEACCKTPIKAPSRENNDNPQNIIPFGLSVFPNPVEIGHSVHISANKQISSVSLYDITGKFVTNLSIVDEDSAIVVDIPASLIPGYYSLSLAFDDEIIVTKLYVY